MPKCGRIFLLTLFSGSLMAQTYVDEPAVITRPVVDNPLQLEITEWPVPWENSRPRDPDVAPNGVIWLVGQGGDYAARFDPASKEFTRKDLPPGTGPHNLIIEDDGTLWIAGNRQAFIGRMNPYTGELTRFTLPDEAARDPHTLVFSGKNEIWFTLQWSNFIGRLNKRNGHVDLVPMQTAQARPYGIKMDSKGHPWVACWAPMDWRPSTPKHWNWKLFICHVKMPACAGWRLPRMTRSGTPITPRAILAATTRYR